MNFHFVTLFPGVFSKYFEESILGRAVKSKIIKTYFYNPIDKVPKLKHIDDKPYGGGPGMVLQAQPFFDCITEAKKTGGKIKVIFFTPGGEEFTQEHARNYSKYDTLIFLCGRYEGIDERVAEATEADHISVGNAVYTGGELPAMMVADAVAREVSGVLGNKESLETERISSRKVYTRPKDVMFEGETYSVPETLLSGHHENIDSFRNEEDKEG